MPTLLTHAPEMPPPLVPPRKRWTREQCAIPEMSVLFEREKLELIDGDLISKIGKNRPHVIASTLMQLWLLEAFGNQFVNVEAPIDVNPADNPINEPEPDLIVLKRGFETITAGNPQPADINLLVEISDSSISFDLKIKADLYARAAISEYWVLDIADRRLISHRDPVSGKYTSITAYNEDESITPLAAPNVSLQVAQVLPKN